MTHKFYLYLIAALMVVVAIAAVPVAAAALHDCSFLNGGKYISVKYGESTPSIGTVVWFSKVPASSGMRTGIRYYVVNAEKGRFQISKTPTGGMASWQIPTSFKSTYYISGYTAPTANIAFFLNSGKFLSTGSLDRAAPSGTIQFVNNVALPAGITANTNYQATDAGNSAFTLTRNGSPVTWTGTGYGYYITL